MSDSKRKSMLRSSSWVALSTLACRILGLVRVMCETRILGGGALATAWGLAFTIPNQLRSILGEGALGAALIPLLTHAEVEHGREEVKRRLGIVFAALGLLLAVLVVLVSAVSLLIAGFTDGYWRQALLLLPAVMPYGLFMCLVGIAGAVLNTRRVFFLPSLGNLLLNIILIGTLLLIFRFAPAGYVDSPEQSTRILLCLAWAVLLSGFLHLGVMAILLARYGVWPAFFRRSGDTGKVLGELFKLAMPGMIGASALQISLIIGELMAGLLGEYAMPALKNTERLVYLPIGVFALSLSMVLFSNLSRDAANRDYQAIRDGVAWGMRLVQYVCIPLAAFFLVFREPLLTLMFFGGHFNREALEATSWAMLFYSLGIPSFCTIKVILPAFYARKDTRTPLISSLIAIGANILFTLLLMYPLQQGGIALASVLSSTANNLLLLWLLRRQGHPIALKGVLGTVIRSLAAVLPLTFLLWLLYPELTMLCAGLPLRGGEIVPLTATGLLFGCGYLGLSRLLGCCEGMELLAAFRRSKETQE